MALGQPPKDNSYNNLVVRESLSASEIFAETLTLGNHTLSVRGTSNQIEFGDRKGPNVIFNVDTSQNATITFPNPGVDSSVVLTEGDQTVNGVKSFNSGIQFLTSGGTPTTLNYYERASVSVSFSSNAMATPINRTLTFIRIGDIITMSAVGFRQAPSGGSAGVITATIPSTLSRFFPVFGSAVRQPIVVASTAVPFNNPGMLEFTVFGTGLINIYFYDPTGNTYLPFSNVNTSVGFADFTVTYRAS
jgi:hypothetical protein